MEDKSLDNLTDKIVASYAADRRTQRIGMTFLPSRSKIVDILAQARQILFPGYFGHKKLTEENIRSIVNGRLARLAEELGEQILHCICVDRHCDNCADPDDCHREAGRNARDFLERIDNLRQLLALDAQAAFDGDPAAKSIEEIIYCYPGFYAVTVYRIAHELHEMGVPLMSRIMSEHGHSVTGCDIHPGARIGKSLFIDHASGVVIGETTRIGEHVKIYQGVTLGAPSFPKDERGRLIRGLQRHPTIEDNVTIYPNATILGGETIIGEGVTVGGNAYITESIRAHHLVVQEQPPLQVKSKTDGKQK